jgi:hypothetical protein
VLPSQREIDCLADRIENAFNLRYPEWYRGCSTARVWSSAAMVLWQAHRENAEVPLDPELFVASQPLQEEIVDPWSILARSEAGLRYKSRVRRIIRLLRAELRREIRRVVREVRDGAALASILTRNDPRLSPLGLFISAHRFGRPDLAARVESRAALQHERCPLYRWACLPLLSAELYPLGAAGSPPVRQEGFVTPRKVPSLN